MFPDDSQKDLATVLSYMAGRTLSKEEIWKAMEMPRSTYYDRLEKGTLITADNLRRVATNLGINRAELLTRYRLIDPEEIKSLAEQISEEHPLSSPPSGTAVITDPARTTKAKRTKVSQLRQSRDRQPLEAAQSTDLVTLVSNPQ